jgi:hypothetical protein
MKKMNEFLTYAVVLRPTDSSIRTICVNADRNQEGVKSGNKLFV